LIIKGVTFDFGGTLALGDFDREVFRNSLFNYLRSLGFSESKVRLNKVREGMLEKLRKVRSINRELRFEDMYQGMLFKVGIHPEITILEHIHNLYLLSFNTELIPGVKEVLKALTKKYTLAVISNAISNVPRYVLEKYGLRKYFEIIVISRDLGIRKPDPEIFNYTLRNLGLKSEEVIHVGDSLEHDVQGANNAGMKSVWMRNNDKVLNFRPDYTINSFWELTSFL
jgi:HAD superfamily hydrolase (TIGR01549 family)